MLLLMCVLFQVSVCLEAVGGDLYGLAPELHDMGTGFWFSYELFGMVRERQQGRNFDQTSQPSSFHFLLNTHRERYSILPSRKLIAFRITHKLHNTDLTLSQVLQSDRFESLTLPKFSATSDAFKVSSRAAIRIPVQEPAKRWRGGGYERRQCCSIVSNCLIF